MIRLGKKTGDEIPICRPLKIILNSELQKKQIMRNVSNLAKSVKFKDISIAHDMSRDEREMEKGLRKKAEAMNLESPLGEYRFRVRGPPGDMKIMKVKVRRNLTPTTDQQ